MYKLFYKVVLKSSHEAAMRLSYLVAVSFFIFAGVFNFIRFYFVFIRRTLILLPTRQQ